MGSSGPRASPPTPGQSDRSRQQRRASGRLCVARGLSTPSPLPQVHPVHPEAPLASSLNLESHPPRGALERKVPQRGPQRRLDRRLEAVAKAVGGGYCRLQMPLKPALAVRGTVAGHKLGALEEGGGTSRPSNDPWAPCSISKNGSRTKKTWAAWQSLQLDPAPTLLIQQMSGGSRWRFTHTHAHLPCPFRPPPPGG